MEYTSSLPGLVLLVCFIMVLVKMFQNGYTGLGIASILLACCGGIGFLVALVFGWIKAKEWNITTLMIIYTIAFVLWAGLLIIFPVPIPQFDQTQLPPP